MTWVKNKSDVVYHCDYLYKEIKGKLYDNKIWKIKNKSNYWFYGKTNENDVNNQCLNEKIEYFD